MPHSFTVSSVCSPIDSPVEGSFTPGARGLKSDGRNFDSALSLLPVVRAKLRSEKARAARRENITAGFDIESTPPAIPTPVRPARIESATLEMAVMPVMQLSTMV